jgi:hypothetical protein
VKLKGAMIAWTPKREVKVGPWPDTSGWSKSYDVTDGACFMRWGEFTEDQRQKALFVVFHTMVVRDEVDPSVAHDALMVIDEYRELIAPDT